MGEKPENLILIEFDPKLEFNGEKVSFVEIDLKHINYGKGERKKRSHFTWQQVSKIIEDYLDGEDLTPDSEDKTHFYFVFEFFFKGRTFKLVFCQDKTDFSLGIITLYRIS